MSQPKGFGNVLYRGIPVLSSAGERTESVFPVMEECLRRGLRDDPYGKE
jgi:hypothetical protein